MSKITFTAEITEFAIESPKNYEKVSFDIYNSAVAIIATDNKGHKIPCVEIEKDDAIKLAKLILHNYE